MRFTAAVANLEYLVFKEVWETVGEKFHHLEVRLVPPQYLIDHNWFLTTSEQIMALENTRWDEEVEMYGRIGRVKGPEDVIQERRDGQSSGS